MDEMLAPLGDADSKWYSRSPLQYLIHSVSLHWLYLHYHGSSCYTEAFPPLMYPHCTTQQAGHSISRALSFFSSYRVAGLPNPSLMRFSFCSRRIWCLVAGGGSLRWRFASAQRRVESSRAISGGVLLLASLLVVRLLPGWSLARAESSMLSAIFSASFVGGTWRDGMQ